MSGVKTALTRKFGPLPAWAWALILGAAIYIFRTRKSLGSTGAQVAAQTDAPLAPLAPDSGSGVGSGTGGGSGGGGFSDIGAGGNPLTGTDSAQLPPDRQLLDPITLSPGESVYDPNSGSLFTPGAKPKAKAKTKRAKKAKPHHAPTKSVPKGGHHKTRTRSVAKTLTGRKKKGTGGAHNPKHGGKPRNGGSPIAPRVRAHATPNPHPVQRQRPAPQHKSTPKPRPKPHYAQAPPAHPTPPRRRRKK